MAIRASDRVTLAVVATPTSVETYYRKQASALAAPAKPTTSVPTGWSLTEPAYTEGSTDTLYTVQRTGWGDGSFEYGNVQKSSSFEAAKQAYNAAAAASAAAASVQQQAEARAKLDPMNLIDMTPVLLQDKTLWRATKRTWSIDGSGNLVVGTPTTVVPNITAWFNDGFTITATGKEQIEILNPGNFTFTAHMNADPKMTVAGTGSLPWGTQTAASEWNGTMFRVQGQMYSADGTPLIISMDNGVTAREPIETPEEWAVFGGGQAGSTLVRHDGVTAGGTVLPTTHWSPALIIRFRAAGEQITLRNLQVRATDPINWSAVAVPISSVAGLGTELASANGKYTSSTVAPTTANGTGKAIGSVWEVNVNGVTTGKYVWTGSVWTEMKVGSALIADTIIGKTISGGTITGTLVESLEFAASGNGILVRPTDLTSGMGSTQLLGNSILGAATPAGNVPGTNSRMPAGEITFLNSKDAAGDYFGRVSLLNFRGGTSAKMNDRRRFTVGPLGFDAFATQSSNDPNGAADNVDAGVRRLDVVTQLRTQDLEVRGNIYGAPGAPGTARTNWAPVLDYAEFTTNKAFPNGVVTAVGNFTRDTAATNNTTFVTPYADGILWFNPGVYAIRTNQNIGFDAATGRSFVDIEQLIGGTWTIQGRWSIPVGEDRVAASLPGLRLTAGTQIRFTSYRNIGAAGNQLFTRVAVTRIGSV